MSECLIAEQFAIIQIAMPDLDSIGMLYRSSSEESMQGLARVKKQLLFMKRAGLINERAGHIYEMNRYLYIHLKHIIQEPFT